MFYIAIEKSLENKFNNSEEYSEMSRALSEKLHKSNEFAGDYEPFYDMQCSEAFNDLVNLVNTLTNDENVRKNLLNNYAYFAVNVYTDLTDYVLDMFNIPELV